jgi:hypothetical protein
VKSSSLCFCRTRVLVQAIAVGVAFLSAGIARADLGFSDFYVGTNFKIQISNFVALPGTQLEGVTLRAVGLNGAKPNTFDSTKSGRGGTGITTSTLHQIWSDDSSLGKTPTLDMNEDYPFTQSLDTHFLVWNANLTTVKTAPTENRPSPANHLYDPWGGYGTYLRGAFSDTTALASTWDFAYLVVPRGTTVNLDFEIGAPYKTSETIGGSFLVNVPEPSTFVLLTMSLLGLLVCRRRFGR